MSIKLYLIILPLLIMSLITGCSEGDPKLEVSPSELDFGTTQNTKTISIHNAGNDDGITKSGVKSLNYELDPSPTWISVSPGSGSCGKDETDQVTVSIDRSGISTGQNSGRIDITSNGGNQAVSVSMSVTNSAPQIDSTTIYIDGNQVSSTSIPTVIVETPVQLSVFASDQDAGDDLSFSWNSSAGSFNQTNSASVVWSCESAISSAQVFVTVSDGQDSANDTLEFIVLGKPFLTGGSVTPGSGLIGEEYAYSVVFTNPIDSAPKVAEVVIDGNTYAMTANSSDYESGATYEYQSNLADGSHNYRFKFIDHRDSVLYFPTDGYKTGPIVTIDTNIVYDSSVVLVDEQDSLNLESVVDSTYTFSYTGVPPQIEVGDILMSTDSGGYLRRVLSVNTSGNQSLGLFTTITTGFVSIAEAFVKINFDTTIVISLDENLFEFSKRVGRQPYLAQGVELSDGLVNFSEFPLFDDYLNGQDVGIFIEEGSIGFQPSLELRVHIGGNSNEVYCAATGTITMEVTPIIDALYEFALIEEVIVGYIPIPLEVAGIPLEIVFSLYAGCDVNANISGTAKFNIYGEKSITLGGHYYNNNFSNIYSQSANWDAEKPQWNAQAGVLAKVYLRPEVSVKVFQVVGPYLDVKPYLKLDGEVTVNPSCWEYGVYAGFEANAGLELDIFIRSWSYNIPLYDTETTLAHDEDCVVELPEVTTKPV
ncbi:MAG: hypothetical protein U9N55_03855, partial [candidate division Zixibacteria bacterium]|nr:hypothetical protein [candidate division Zixibacteria bacterium]